jgi:electron transfer flavoprotein beta subunit
MEPLKIYVCVKHVPDSAATITLSGPDRIAENITFLINPYDEHALTAAAELGQRHPGAEVVAVSLGPPAAENTLRSAMAMGADRSLLVVCDRGPDSLFTARALKAAIAADGRPGIILAGKEAIDTEGMQTVFRLAANFGFPAATNVVKLELAPGAAVVECEKEGGAVDVLRLGLPCVIGCGKGLNTPRYPTFPDIVKARKKEVRKIELAALGIAPCESGAKVVALAAAAEDRRPRALSGTPADIARELVRILKEEARVI